MRALLVSALLAAITACGQAPHPIENPPTPSTEVAETIVDTQVSVAEVAVPAIVEIRSVVESIAPPPPANDCIVDPAAVDLIVRFEVSGRSYYAARLEGVIWPGLRSGPTWGIGYDGGQQTRATISRDWADHPQVLDLIETSGLVGESARESLPRFRDVRTKYVMAEQVFAKSVLPTYCRLARRTFRDGWDTLPPLAQGGLVSLVYNRGASTGGDRRREVLYIAEVCAPSGDVKCIAKQLRSMKRLWVGTTQATGLQRRYEATAVLVESSAL
jgi:predicted small lipoprotein YifL